jgi:hypothetical protein
LRELRAKLAGLPYICRSSYIKVFELKRNTNSLMADMNNKLLHLAKLKKEAE